MKKLRSSSCCPVHTCSSSRISEQFDASSLELASNDDDDDDKAANYLSVRCLSDNERTNERTSEVHCVNQLQANTEREKAKLAKTRTSNASSSSSSAAASEHLCVCVSSTSIFC